MTRSNNKHDNHVDRVESDFVRENYDFVLECSPVGQSLQDFWTTSFAHAVQKLNIKTVNLRAKSPDWGVIALSILEKSERSSITTTNITTNTTTKKGTKRSSKTDSCSLSTTNCQKLTDLITNMKNESKWEFKRDDNSISYLEDVMLKHIKKCSFEHCALSLIFDVDDKVWDAYFTENEKENLAGSDDCSLPDIPESIQSILVKCSKIVETTSEETSNMNKQQQQKEIVDNLYRYVESIESFDPYKEFNEHWVIDTLRHFISLYRWNVLERMNSHEWSEIDFVLQAWSQLDKVFRNIFVDTKRDVSCVATLARVNNERCIDGLMPISEQAKSVRPDLVLCKEDVEYGLGEVGKYDLSGIGKKEVVETQLHSPKVLKDMFLRAAAKVGDDEAFVRKFKTVCFNQTCFRMSISVLDCPKGIVCRMNTTEEYQIPKSVSLFSSGIIPIIKLTLQAKMIVEKSVRLLEQFTNERGITQPGFKSQRRNKSNTVHIPPCLTVESNKKTKINNEVSLSTEASSSTLSSSTATSSKPSSSKPNST
ncbi:hypothetical protein INT45_006116 [Circinella minor]|uniref:Uncharacterized protein n=1 Tax=Circinella minor TaxID=1195481 RepID=A0A8H7VJV5_9FUNG|nr:hypothetical protein INT45_006116 [Circinella minor]